MYRLYYCCYTTHRVIQVRGPSTNVARINRAPPPGAEDAGREWFTARTRRRTGGGGGDSYILTVQWYKFSTPGCGEKKKNLFGTGKRYRFT